MLGGRLVSGVFGLGDVSSFFAEGLIILGWVANWRPIEVFLYDWWPLAAKATIVSAPCRGKSGGSVAARGRGLAAGRDHASASISQPIILPAQSQRALLHSVSGGVKLDATMAEGCGASRAAIKAASRP